MSKRKYNYKKDNKGIKVGLIIFSTLILLVAIIPIINSIENQKGKKGELTMNLSMSGFSPNEITAKVGEPINIYMINLDNSMHADGGGWHQFASDELNFDYKVGPLDKQSISFVVDKPGVYSFYCDICCGGKENPSMQGSITIV